MMLTVVKTRKLVTKYIITGQLADTWAIPQFVNNDAMGIDQIVITPVMPAVLGDAVEARGSG